MPVKSVEADFLFTQDSKSSFLMMGSVKEEEGRGREEREQGGLRPTQA